MRADTRITMIRPVRRRQRVPDWVPVALLAVCIPWGIWSFYTLWEGGDSELVSLYTAGGWFVILACAYLSVHGVRGLAWCSVPVLITFRAVLEFGAIPGWRFATGADQVDAIYVHAMLLTLMGFAAFWAGGLLFKQEGELDFRPVTWYTTHRVAFVSALLLCVGLLANFVMWRSGLSNYLSITNDAASQQSSLPFIGTLSFTASMLQAALVISAIEVLGKRTREKLTRLVFGISVVTSVGFGVISGMKEEVLMPFLLLVVVYTMTNRRVPRSAFLLPVLLVLIYPLVNAYRHNLNKGYRSSATTIAGQAAVLEKTVEDVMGQPFTTREQSGSNFSNTTDRLSLLTLLRDIIGLPAPSLLNGDEKIWLAPFYPLVPRFLWKDKPVLDKSKRLSLALGRPSTTASALTPIGDLYSMYGTYGVILGMLVYGVATQIYMNWAGRGIFSERRMFIYILLLITLINLEEDIAGLLAGVVLVAIKLAITSRVIYGPAVPQFPKNRRRVVIGRI